MKVSTRTAFPDDKPAIWRLYESEMKHHIDAIRGWDTAWQLTDFDKSFSASSTCIVEVDGAFSGYVQLDLARGMVHGRRRGRFYIDTTQIMLIRSTTDEDWKILKEIRLASLLDAPTAFGVSYATAAANSDAEWRERAANRGQAQFLLAFVNGKAVGMVGGAASPKSDLNLIAMWVRHEYRGTIAAASLVGAIKERAVSQGHARVVLDVSPGNERAAAFYRKQGFSFLPAWEPLASHPDITVQKMEWRTSINP